MQLSDSVPVQLMHKDKTGSLEEVSARTEYGEFRKTAFWSSPTVLTFG